MDSLQKSFRLKLTGFRRPLEALVRVVEKTGGRNKNQPFYIYSAKADGSLDAQSMKRRTPSRIRIERCSQTDTCLQG